MFQDGSILEDIPPLSLVDAVSYDGQFNKSSLTSRQGNTVSVSGYSTKQNSENFSQGNVNCVLHAVESPCVYCCITYPCHISSMFSL